MSVRTPRVPHGRIERVLVIKEAVGDENATGRRPIQRSSRREPGTFEETAADDPSWRLLLEARFHWPGHDICSGPGLDAAKLHDPAASGDLVVIDERDKLGITRGGDRRVA